MPDRLSHPKLVLIVFLSLYSLGFGTSSGHLLGQIDTAVTLAPGSINTFSTTTPPTPADTTSPWRYYPLQIGNAWEWEDPGTNARWRREVVSDTQALGQRYFKMRLDEFDSSDNPLPNSPRYEYVRYDSISTELRALLPDHNVEDIYLHDSCPLGAEFDTTIDCELFSDVEVFGSYNTEVTIPNSPVPDTIVTSVKSYHWSFDIGPTYAAGIGRVQFFLKGLLSEVLYYARIDDQEWGIPRYPTVDIESDDNSPLPETDNRLVIDLIYPNPVSEIANVQVSGAARSSLRFVVYDLLGRVVLVNQSQPKAITSTDVFQIRLHHIPPGIYTLRLQQGEVLSSRSFVLL